MTRKIILLALLISASAFAQDASEEAIILNQELQFLEESANNVSIVSMPSKTPQEKAAPIDTESLEEKYFGNEMDDTVASKTAAPRRRREN